MGTSKCIEARGLYRIIQGAGVTQICAGHVVIINTCTNHTKNGTY